MIQNKLFSWLPLHRFFSTFFPRTFISLYLNHFLYSEKSMNLTSTIAPIAMVISRTNIGSGDSFLLSYSLSYSLSSSPSYSLLSSPYDIPSPSFLDVRNMVLVLISFPFFSVKPFKEVLSQISPPPSKGNGQGKDNTSKNNGKSSDNHRFCNA